MESSQTSLWGGFKAELMHPYWTWKVRVEADWVASGLTVLCAIKKVYPTERSKHKVNLAYTGILVSHPAKILFSVVSAVCNNTYRQSPFLAFEPLRLPPVLASGGSGFPKVMKDSCLKGSQCAPNPYGKWNRQVSQGDFWRADIVGF